MTEETLDIVALIKDNPLVRFKNKDYNNNLINKIKEKFTSNEQQLFLTNFYCYLNYDTETDFVVELHKIWKWIGYGRIDECVRHLKKHFEINKHYKIFEVEVATSKTTEKEGFFAPQTCGAKTTGVPDETRGGSNKENIKLTVDCFKKLCLKAGTKKADEIHDYYIKLGKVMNEVLYEESEQLRNQLQLKDEEIASIKKETFVKYLNRPINYKNVVFAVKGTPVWIPPDNYISYPKNTYGLLGFFIKLKKTDQEFYYSTKSDIVDHLFKDKDRPKVIRSITKKLSKTDINSVNTRALDTYEFSSMLSEYHWEILDTIGTFE